MSETSSNEYDFQYWENAKDIHVRAPTSVSIVEADVLIIGAGAAGLMCAIEAGRRKRKVILLDRAKRPGEKIRISGGGRCNFTNLHCSPEHFLSQNPRYAISALSRYTPLDFLALIKKHRIAYHEKKLGQLFCDGSSQQVIRMLLEESRQASVDLRLQAQVIETSKPDSRYLLRTNQGSFCCESLVIASGGLSIPKMGATGIGYEIARQFGLSVVPTSAALVPFTLTESEQRIWSVLAGVSLSARVKCGRACFDEGLLFTHRGLSGPAILQCSSYWRPKEPVRINLVPEHDINLVLKAERQRGPRQEVTNFLNGLIPKRLAQLICDRHLSVGSTARVAGLSNEDIQRLASALNDWCVVPAGTEGYRVAEVTLGGVDTDELDSKTMMSKRIENLFFIGEVVDVTGHLGGFNFQWAWSSGYVAGQYV